MKEVKNLFEFDAEVRRLRTRRKHCLFRGQRLNWPLLPSICRETERKFLLDQEKELLDSFKSESKPCLHKIPKNDWDWLVVAQHHGLPTRLLDWTSNAYTALWFALEKSREELNCKPEVWVFTPSSSDFITDLSKKKPFRGTRTKLFETSFKIPRVKAQKGCFALLKHVENSKSGFVPFEENKHVKNNLNRILIHPASAVTLLEALEKKGFNHEKIYPDIDKVAQDIKERILQSAV